MSYFSRMPPPRQYYQGYYSSDYHDYSYYGSYGHGGYGPPRPPPARGAWRGARGGRGGWSGGRGASSSSSGGGGGSALTTVKMSPAAASTAASTAVKTEPKPEPVSTAATTAVKTEIKKEPASQDGQKAATPAATVKSEPGSVPNGGPASVAPATPSGGRTTTTTTATGTRTTAATASATAKVSSASAAPANKATATTATAATGASAAATGTAANATKATAVTALSDDQPFPESVTEKFFPNRCDLCSVVFPVGRDIFIPEKGGLNHMESNLQSTMHYSGKCHKKRLRQFMQDYCRRHRLVTPRRAWELMRDTPAVPRASDAKETPKVDLYCKTCDLSFTSVQHASQHYAGKNHQRKVEGKPPLKSGYYNARTGRWQRLPPGMEHERQPYHPRPPAASVVRPIPPAPAAADPSVVTVQVAPGNLVNAGVKLAPAAATTATAGTGTGVQSKFHCELCGVSATCQLQLDTHITGSRHKLQARKLGLPVPVDKPVVSTEPASSATAEPAAKRPRRDYSIYKTPSGKFYCLPCDLTMNSETQFAQHFESKKHQAEVARQRKTVAA